MNGHESAITKMYNDNDASREYYFLLLDTLNEKEHAPMSNDTMSKFLGKLAAAQEECRKRGIGLPVLPEHIEALMILEGLYE